MQVNHKQLNELLAKCYETNMPLMISGGIGIGKSTVVKDSAKKLAELKKINFVDWNSLPSNRKEKAIAQEEELKSLFFVDMRLSQKDFTDLNGIPFVDGQSMRWFPPQVMRLLSRDDCHAILFFDEITDAQLPTMKAAYQLVLDRACGEVSFGPHVRVVAAGNRAIDKSNVNEMPKALDNRFFHVELKDPSAKEWTKYVIDKIDNRVLAFINSNPIYLNQDISTVTTKAFATPRANEKLGKSIIGIPDSNEDFLEILASASCGDGYASDFISFIKYAKDINPESILNDPKSFKYLNMGAKWFAVSAITEYYRANGSAVVKGLIELIADHQDPDLGVVQFSLCNKANKGFITSVGNSSKGQELYTRYSKFIL